MCTIAQLCSKRIADSRRGGVRLLLLASNPCEERVDELLLLLLLLQLVLLLLLLLLNSELMHACLELSELLRKSSLRG